MPCCARPHNRLMNGERIQVNRTLVGVLTLCCWTAALAIWLFVPGERFWLGGFVRVGLLMAAFWLALPTRFRDATRRGVRVLRGTDPLPFPWEVHRVASFGFHLEATFDWSRPWACLRPLLGDPRVTLRPYGRLERPIRVFRNQYGMQMRKRRRPR